MAIMPPDRLTPETLQTVTFPSARLGKRGVDEDHVRLFCEWVETELIRLLNEKSALEQEVGRLRKQARPESESDPGPAAADDPEHDPQLVALTVMLRAKQTADKYIANAQEFSRDIAADARKRRDDILGESEKCRTHLRAYLESLTRSIDEWEEAERRLTR